MKLSPQQAQELLELAQQVRIHAVDMDNWQYPGGFGKTLKCSIIGSVGACWASLHPEAYDFTYSPNEGIVEVFPVEDRYAEIMEYMPRHMGITEQEFEALLREPCKSDVLDIPDAIADAIEDLVKKGTGLREITDDDFSDICKSIDRLRND